MTSPRELIARAATRRPEHLALAVPGVGVTQTYAQLAAAIAARRPRLTDAGVGPGGQVAVQLADPAARIAWTFAALEAGAVVLPLPASARPAELAEVLTQGEVGFLVGSGDPPGGYRALSGRPWTEVSLFARASFPPPLPGTPGTPEAPVLRQISSGSTGTPKHMLRSEAQLAEDYGHFCETLGLGPDEVILVTGPLSHAYGALGMWAAFHLGATLLALPRFLPTPTLEAAREHEPTVMLATPPILDILGKAALDPGLEQALSSVDLLISSAGPLRSSVHDAFRDRFQVPVRVQYGSTETLSASIDDGALPFVEGCMGTPYAGVELAVLDDEGRPLPPGEVGAVAVRSPAAVASYEDAPEASAKVFHDGWVLPGDRGYLDANGVLFLHGRADLINIGGDKVDPLEVARVLREELGVTEAVVLAGERAGLPVVRAVLEGDPEVLTPALVRDACRRRLAPHKVPSLVQVVRSLPRDVSGKLRRDRLPEP